MSHTFSSSCVKIKGNLDVLFKTCRYYFVDITDHIVVATAIHGYVIFGLWPFFFQKIANIYWMQNVFLQTVTNGYFMKKMRQTRNCRSDIRRYPYEFNNFYLSFTFVAYNLLLIWRNYFGINLTTMITNLNKVTDSVDFTKEFYRQGGHFPSK